MKKLVLVVVLLVLLTSCRSGWNCKKRYVEVSKKNVELKPLS
ncbi:hypothetical protein elemo153D_phanotate40 [Flavobacterium phage vB_FspP_elemoA_15-3D]|jgi:hypothetical protein|uniref:Lipoprotein n=2 Tax=Elemovirus TaxID=2948694 RepID=A0A7D7IYE2_9CAUD|nr:hypothetical protein KNV10_gp72 [Flavobacterium phage vB_FspP_elemoA_7-9A]YP_010356115.1 hypothetical protein M1M19_gp74 [Flavobacterium phage vB_FspP_elemoB_14-3B]QMP84658.1 hypothetical protein elemo131A_phanotate39 [Flavobacterium phage vB_FspP_elemoA_13-1A]QMP84748.1 hypothetical protein elemo131C_phanotate39 [Flavobacterium phage vB_FspP_elemoC_13-1C]QMP85111.1 hypothetical protein elemo25C_phanotate39 [Flavobacterium phage vB_FspP_elemoA_2-5C]QMP86274.1 hypothetical protein elemo119C_